jgi:phage repressor protein C with HTH and peptisase S24 domain
MPGALLPVAHGFATADPFTHQPVTRVEEQDAVVTRPRPTRRRLGIAVVRGRSMEPTLRDGDRLLVLWGGAPRVGRLAVVRLPEGTRGPRPVSVKRLARPAPGEPGSWWVERDNPREGVDSWHVGGIPDADVLGRVLVRLPTVVGRAWRA